VTGDEALDEFSDDDNDFDATAAGGASIKRRKTPNLTTTATVADDDGGIMRAYKNIPDTSTYQMYILDEDVEMPSDILGPSRAYPVFIGLLSLAAALDCRILDPSDLDHPR